MYPKNETVSAKVSARMKEELESLSMDHFITRSDLIGRCIAKGILYFRKDLYPETMGNEKFRLERKIIQLNRKIAELAEANMALEIALKYASDE